jgi:hypothetical protein
VIVAAIGVLVVQKMFVACLREQNTADAATTTAAAAELLESFLWISLNNVLRDGPWKNDVPGNYSIRI